MSHEVGLIARKRWASGCLLGSDHPRQPQEMGQISTLGNVPLIAEVAWGAVTSHNPSKMPQPNCHREHLPREIIHSEEETETIVLT